MASKSQTIRVKLEELIPTDHNPRQITKKDFEKLKQSLRDDPEFLEVRGIVVDEDMTILGGHQRVEALKALGETEVDVVQVIGWSDEKKRRFVIRDNIQNGDWDMDELANAWSDLPLEDWGLGVPIFDIDELVDIATAGTIEDYSEDTDYDLNKLIREECSSSISSDFNKWLDAGKIRPEIAEIIRRRILQCTIFNFDELIKFYRSGDASAEEQDLLRRLYLVFITPKEAFENGMLEISNITGNIYDRKLMGDGGEE